ncbi:MAG: crotonase/enoyl-CoA hydratase family protein [Gluconacetobacter diazotrophicus]|nr:crotonase/enoyl-CoA hydratase family protein [Gluconacetobacter diazotrophicus]
MPTSQSTNKITIERRGQVMLIGINRPYIHNRVDPEAFRALARAYHDYDRDDSVRAAVLFGHGENFSRGVDVDAFTELARSGKPTALGDGELDPLGKSGRLTKPMIAVAHGDTWNMGHELFLAADIRVAAADTEFGQDEASHARFPGGGATVRFVRDAGWGNAMRYMLTGDHWSAADAFRFGLVQDVVPGREEALAHAIGIAERVARCAPLGVRTTLASAHLAVDPAEDAAYSELDAQYGALYRTEDFLEGRNAPVEGRTPVYHGR